MPLVRKSRGVRNKGHHSDDDESTPICRCRVLYLGSAVPHITKDGLQGIQEPLKELYPDTGLSSLKGIDSWLSVWSNGLLLENVDEKNTKITRFFPIESLHYCAAVRNVLVPANRDGPSTSSNEKVQKFLPLDSPFAQLPNLNHPPLFACILRRTTGIKVLECHAFICKREMAANALVRCCFHAYADSTYAKQLENGGTLATNGGLSTGNGYTNGNGGIFKDDRPMQRSVTPLDSIEKVTGWQALSQNGDSDIIVVGNSTDEEFRDGPVTSSTPSRDKFEFRAEFPDEDEIYDGDENHKIWSGNNSTLGHNGTSELVYLEADGTLKSIKSHNSRLSRPRQFVSPPPPPPPPPPQHFSLLKSAEADASSKKKMKKKLKKDKEKQQLQPQYLIRPASMMNLSSPHGLQPILAPRPGSVMNGPVSHRPGSAMSTLTRTRPLHSQQLIPVPHHGNGYAYPPQPIYGHIPPQFAISHPQLVTPSKSKKKQKQMLTAVPILAPTPMPMMGHHHPGLHAIPSPMNGTPSPMYHHHHQKMMMEDYERSRGMKGPPQDKMLIPQNPAQYATIERGYHYHARPLNGESATLMSNKSKGKRKGSREEEEEEREGSPFNSSGIYRKGHLNERAFSYSIRQEHRSRSFGSLANLQFANETGGPHRPSGSPPHSAEGMKKEREIIQMVRDLDLSGDEIERSHVPAELYPHHRKPAVNGYRKQNGHGPRITHR